MRYLICENCRGYYELQPGETPEEFTNRCECGGKLKFENNIDSISGNQSNKQNNDEKLNSGDLKGIILFSLVLVIIFSVILSFFVGITAFIGGFLAFIFLVIFFSWIYNDEKKKYKKI